MITESTSGIPSSIFQPIYYLFSLYLLIISQKAYILFLISFWTI
jgi:hypothetical protein